MNLRHSVQFNFSLLVIVPFIFISCKTSRSAGNGTLTLINDYCQPSVAFGNSQPSFYYNLDSLLKIDTVISRRLSVQSLMMANATGTLPLINTLLLNIEDSSVDGRIKRIQMLQRLQQQMTLSRLGIEGIAAELGCEAERTNRIINYLNAKGSKRTNRLTIAAIIAGSITTLLPVVIPAGGTQNTTVIAGAGLSVLIGLAALKPNPNTVDLTYQRNLLSDIWYGPVKSKDFPVIIWIMLTQKVFSYNQQMSIREGIKRRWLKIDFNGSIDSKTENLIFKSGGTYSADNLQTRYNLLKHAQAAIMLLITDVESFLAEVYALYKTGTL